MTTAAQRKRFAELRRVTAEKLREQGKRDPLARANTFRGRR